MSDTVDIKRMWALLKESNAETMQLKLYRNEGDAKPFRAIIFVEGEEAVEKINNFIIQMSGETLTTPRIKA